MNVDAMLCDAATVREGLLNVLGAGITRVWRDTFPAPMGTQLALLLHASAEEMGKQHKLTITMNDSSKTKIAEVALDFSVSPNANNRPGEMVTVPLVASFQQQPLPKQDSYTIDLNIDGKVVKTLNFFAGSAPKVPTVPTGSAKG